MRSRTLALATAAAAIMLVPSLGSAQEEPSTVIFDGVGFTFDEVLGASVNITEVPAQPPIEDGISFPSPAHLAFTVYGPRAEDTKAPRTISAPGVVRYYRTADLADYWWPTQQLENLQTLLETRPDLATFTTPGEFGFGQPLPFVLDGSAGQAIHAVPHYVDTPDLAGIAYLTAFRQDTFPFAADEFWYTFQGLSPDGSWYVAVDFRVEAEMFPTKVGQQQAKRISTLKQWLRYQDQSLQKLDGASPDAFTPPLEAVDALIASVTFEA
jgi:hypothetical protein